MKQFTFIGKTPTEALSKALESCGENAEVVSTKKIKEKTSRMNGVYEVVVVVNDESVVEKMSASPTKRVVASIQQESESITDLKKQNTELMQQLEKMNRNMYNIQETIMNSLKTESDIIIAPEFIEVYNLLKSISFEEELRNQIIKILIKTTPIKYKKDQTKIELILEELLKKMIKPTNENIIDIKEKKVIIFFGPTGVGKTTTMAKVGSRLKYKNKDLSIGIVNLDTYRVGAEKQIEIYANNLKMKFKTIKEPKELIKTISSKMREENYILIDTAGSGQYDNEKIKVIKDFLEYNKRIKIEKYLVIPANIKYSDMIEIYESFKYLDISNIIFTKTDETNDFGNVFTFLYKTKLRPLYLTTGQTVPTDMELAEKDIIIDLLLKKKKRTLKKLITK